MDKKPAFSARTAEGLHPRAPHAAHSQPVARSDKPLGLEAGRVVEEHQPVLDALLYLLARQAEDQRRNAVQPR